MLRVEDVLTTPIMNIIAGTVGGMAGVVAGHPFDTIKVRLQSQSLADLKYKGTIDCFMKIIRHEGIFGLFKGMLSPLIGVGIVNACLFGVYGWLLELQHATPTTASNNQIFIAGCGSGFVNCLIGCPTELAKIQLQNQIESHNIKGPLECLSRIYKQHGIRGCFKGLTSTIFRDSPSFGVYFVTYDYSCKFLSTHGDGDINGLGHMAAGGMAGVASWISTYPMDVVKTKIQAQDFSKALIYRGTIDCFTKTIAKDGLPSLFSGMYATIIRAFPTNAVIFFAYQHTMKWLSIVKE